MFTFVGYLFSLITKSGNRTSGHVTKLKGQLIVGMRRHRDWHVLIMLFVAVFAIWAISYYFITVALPREFRGEFGDTFGAVNSLFSGLALAGIVYTIILQRTELKLQRKDLKATRDEFKVQNATAKRQRFENSFFRLLELFNSMSQSFIYTDASGVEYHGREFFKGFIQKGIDFSRPPGDNDDDYYYIGGAFRTAFFTVEHFLQPWFGSIEKVLIFIDKDKELKKDEKDFYVSLLRSQLTRFEMVTIGLYVIFPIFPTDSLGHYVSKYRLLREDDIERSNLPYEVVESYARRGREFYAPPYEGVQEDDVNET